MLQTDTKAPVINRALRDRIGLTRVLAIIGMMFVHVPPEAPEKELWIPIYDLLGHGVQFASTSLFGLLQSLVVEGPGRTSACLLSIIAGFLAAHSLSQKNANYKRYVHKRLHTIYLPMVFWGVITIMLFSVVSLYLHPTFIDDGMQNSQYPWLFLLNSIFFLTDAPPGATIQLSFLRDVFVCAVLTPVLLYAIKRVPFFLLLTLTLVYLLDLNLVLILRPLILLAFTIGLMLASQGVDVTRWDNQLHLWGVCFILVTVSLVVLKHNVFPMFTKGVAPEVLLLAQDKVLYPLSRLTGSLFFWSLTLRLVNTKLGKFAGGLAPLLFVAYCTHVIVLGIVYAFAWEPFFGDQTGMLYPLWFFGAPLLALYFASVFLKITGRYLPFLHDFVTGSRGSSKTLPKTRDAGSKKPSAAPRPVTPVFGEAEPIAILNPEASRDTKSGSDGTTTQQVVNKPDSEGR